MGYCESKSYGSEGEVAEEDLHLGEVEEDDGKKHEGSESGRDVYAPVTKEPEGDDDFYRAESVQQDDWVWHEVEYEWGKVPEPAVWVAVGVDGRIEESKGEASAEDKICNFVLLHILLSK